MRAVLQRVARASVEINNTVYSVIGKGLLVLLGIHHEDTESDAEYIIKKTLSARIFDDNKGVMNLSVADTGAEILLVSQFTLYGDMRRGNRPSYSAAMRPESAGPFFESIFEKFRCLHPKTLSGSFGADMQVSLLNAGPVTIILDSGK